MTHEKYKAPTDDRTDCTDQRHGPPVKKVTQHVYRQCSDPHGRAADRSEQSPEPRFGDLSDVRSGGASAESRTESHQYGRRAQQTRTVRGVQHNPTNNARDVCENHTGFYPVFLLHEARRQTSDWIDQIH